jgi:hypothetical protein
MNPDILVEWAEGETTDDSDIDTIVWPDTSAIAERLWSAPVAVNPAAFDVQAAGVRVLLTFASFARARLSGYLHRIMVLFFKF